MFDQKFEEKQRLKERAVTEKAEIAAKHTEKVIQKYMTREEQEVDPIKKLVQIADSKNKKIKTAKKMLEEKRKDLADANAAKIEKAKQAKKFSRIENSRKIAYLKEKSQEKSQLVNEVKEALREDHEQRREIAMLRKMDQEENFNRGKNFHKMYLQKVAESILEKAHRADSIKAQQ